MPGPPRRTPYPYDVDFGGSGAMLGSADPKNPHQVVSQRPPNQDDVTPTSFGYDSANPLFGKWQPYDDMSLGFGVRMQQLEQDKKSRSALGVDTSQQGKFFMGPLFTQVTPGTTDATNGWLDFFELGGALYGVVGRYILKRSADATFSTTGGRDFTAGHTAVKGMTLFQSNATGATKYAFIPMSGEGYYTFDGTTFAQSTVTAICFAQVGREFYRATGTNLVSKVDTNADPTNEANWTAENQFKVGDATSSIVSMRVNAKGVLVIFKTDGVYSLDASGQDIPYFGDLFKHGTGTDNGKVVWAFEDDLWFMYNGDTYRMDADFNLTPAGPELSAQDSSSAINGYVSAGLGHGTTNAYAMLYNSDSGSSYMLKFRSYQHFKFSLGGNLLPAPAPEPVDAWTGSITPALSAMKGTVMFESTVGATSGHSRAWVGFSDGSYGYYTLPCSPDPTACTAMRFSTTTSYLYPPLWHGMFMGNEKAIGREVVQAITLTATSYVAVFYRQPTDSAYTLLSDTFADSFTAPGQSIAYPLGTAGKVFDFRFAFHNSASTTTPIVTTFQHEWLTPMETIRMVFEVLVLCANGMMARDGRPLRKQAQELADLAQTTALAVSTTMTLPDEQLRQIRGIDYGETLGWNNKVQQWQKAIKVTVAELIQQPYPVGTIGRLRGKLVSDLAGIPVGGLANV